MVTLSPLYRRALLNTIRANPANDVEVSEHGVAYDVIAEACDESIPFITDAIAHLEQRGDVQVTRTSHGWFVRTTR